VRESGYGLQLRTAGAWAFVVVVARVCRPMQNEKTRVGDIDPAPGAFGEDVLESGESRGGVAIWRDEVESARWYHPI
jgi:hypothetical protein